jgi:hypothetical protein
MKVISNIDAAVLCFGEAAIAYNELFLKLGTTTFKEEYTFLENSEFTANLGNSSNIASAQKTYWTEILMRAHLASVASIVRTSRWIDVSTREYEAGNIYGWASACRSLMEAAGDNMHSLGAVALSLAENHNSIKRAVEGQNIEEITISGELEDVLIHFTHGRKTAKNENVPHSHKAKFASEYIKELTNMNIAGSSELYSKFCSLVHPADTSVSLLFESTGQALRVNAAIEQNTMHTWAESSKIILGGTLQAAFNPAILTLKVLQKFGVFQQVKELRNTGLEHLPLWKKIEHQL